jgi:N-acetylmuramic acid 6-phosphate etherase
MSASARQRSDEFLKISGQFKLGALVTEASHPVTANLSEAASNPETAGVSPARTTGEPAGTPALPGTAAALKLLFDVDDDVISVYRDFVRSGRAGEIARTVLASLKNGGRVFFTGCGSTGRLSILLDSIWRQFWQKQRAAGSKLADQYEDRTFSVMAGGDYALIKSVEGFEDFALFGKKQIGDLGVSARDTVFAITEGGETSFVIGTAWQAEQAGAKTYFVYNNPDDVLCRYVERSREVITRETIEKINLTTGPMAITGSTRMQATTIQLCVMLTVLEMVVRELVGAGNSEIPQQFLEKLSELQATLKSPGVLAEIARLVELEASVYRSGHKNNYYADHFAIDVLTDTTERSPTYCTPPFRKFDDRTATESWAFLFLPCAETPAAWERLLRRVPRCVDWTPPEAQQLVDADKVERTLETIRKISRGELMRFRIGLDGLGYRELKQGDSAIAVLSGHDSPESVKEIEAQLFAAEKAGATITRILFTASDSAPSTIGPQPSVIRVPKSDFLLDGVTRVGVKMLLNALSTCTMVRLGRVMGNYMIWVVPSNLKLIDRATRYIQKLAGLTYDDANRLLFEVIEYVEPRMKSDQAYPPVVGMAVLRAREGISNQEAEERLRAGARTALSAR